MRAECLPSVALPHTTRLFADFLTGFERVRNFYPRPPLTREWLGEQSSRIVYDSERRRQVADILIHENRNWGASPATLANIERLRAGAMAVVTGQQVSLFGGPLFSLYKALSAIKVAEEVTRAGVDCVPIFWLATEDHDLEEVSSATLLAADGSLTKLTSASQGADGGPVSKAVFGRDITGSVKQARELLGESDVSELLAECYRPSVSFGDAFARLFARLFADFGVVLIDGADPRLHQIASPVYRAAVVGAQDLNAAQLERDRELEGAGYHAQVKITPSSTLLFGVHNGARTPVHRANGRFLLGEEKLSEADLLQRIADEPEKFSGNVLLRPVVQDFLLPTLAYVGGPAEVAYFAQAGVVYENLLGRITPVLPRFSATLVEPRVQQLLQKYGITVADVLQGHTTLAETLAAAKLPPDLAATFSAGSERLDGSFAELTPALQQLDPTLADAAQKAASKMRYQLERLRARAARAQLRRSDEIEHHAARLLNSLYPHHTLQEREIAGIAMLGRYGTGLLPQLHAQVNPGCADHQVLYL